MNSNLNTNAITNTKNTSSVEQNKRQDKIVICDDDKDIVRALEIYLSNRDYELLSAYTGREALDYVKKGDISLVLLDIMMPEMDGLSATKAIRALDREDAGTIPIIAMTANAFDEDEKKCMEAGMNAHLVKPLDIQKMKEAICRYLNK